MQRLTIFHGIVSNLEFEYCKMLSMHVQVLDMVFWRPYLHSPTDFTGKNWIRSNMISPYFCFLRSTLPHTELYDFKLLLTKKLPNKITNRMNILYRSNDNFIIHYFISLPGVTGGFYTDVQLSYFRHKICSKNAKIRFIGLRLYNDGATNIFVLCWDIETKMELSIFKYS